MTANPNVKHPCPKCGLEMWFQRGNWWTGWMCKVSDHAIKTDDGSDVGWWNAQPATGVRSSLDQTGQGRQDNENEYPFGATSHPEAE